MLCRDVPMKGRERGLRVRCFVDGLAAYVLWENVFEGEDNDTKWRNVATCPKYVATFGACLHKMVKTRQDMETC